MTTDEMIAVLQAYKEGKTIQFAFKTDGKFVYTIPKGEGEVNWDFKECNYRVKPEPHYRPFESAEEVMEAIKEHGDWLYYRQSEHFCKIWEIGGCHIFASTSHSGKTLDSSFREAVFADGTPFGKLVEE